jgi:hypothetical protein
MKDRVIGVLLFLLVSTVYYATVLGITCTNDGSHYALVRALSDEHRFEIDTFVDYTGYNDYSSREGHFYTDRPPGTALMAIPFYMSSNVLPKPIALLHQSAYDGDNPRLVYTLMLLPFVGAGATVILYYLLRFYNLSVFASLTTSLAFAFGTVYWKYGSEMFSHAPSGLLVLGSFALAVWIVRQNQLTWLTALALGLVLGFSIVVEYSNAILLAVILGYVVLGLNASLFKKERWWAPLIALSAGIGLPALFLMWYNIVNFGGPLTTSYTFLANPAYHDRLQFATTFVGPLEVGLPGMLWYGFDAAHVDNQGIFLLMPVTLIALPGLWPYFKRYRTESLLALILFGIYLVLFAKHIAFSDGTRDGRYLVPFLPLLFIPLGFALEWLHQLKHDSALKVFTLFIVYGLLFVSARNMIWHIGYSYSYTLDPNVLAHTASIPSNWQYLFNSLFLNWKNVPLLWLVEAIALALIFGGVKGICFLSARKTTAQEPSA